MNAGEGIPEKGVEDIRLMLRVKNGDDAAFEELVAKHRDRTVNLIFHIVGNAEEAEDLAQEAFLRVYKARDRYEPVAQFTTWLYRISYNLALSQRRKAARRPESLSESAVSPQPTPETELTSRETVRAVWDALHKLPENQRTALVLTRMEECSYEEAAKVMDTTSAAIRSLVSRARETLRHQLRRTIETTPSRGDE